MKMKIFVPSLIAVAILLFVSCGKKQERTYIKTAETLLTDTATKNDIYDFEKINNRVALIIELVKNRDKKGISIIINYPLDREYPIPPIKDEKEFIKRFDEIFDLALIEKISNANLENIWVSWRGVYMMYDSGSISIPFLGFECFYDDYNIKFIECSETEKQKKELLITKQSGQN